MLRILIQSAAIGVFAFAISVAGLSAWRSFYQHNEQARQETSAKKPTEEHGQASANVGAKESNEQAIARYSYWLMLFTGVLAFVALIQIGFLISTDNIATKAAQAAQDSADANKRIMEREQRARLTVHQINLPLKADIPLIGKLVVLNSGVTEAQIIRGTAQVYWAKNLPQVFPPDAEKVRPGPIPIEDRVIPGGGHYWWNITQKAPDLKILSQPELDQIMKGEIRLWLIGLIEYSDATKIRHFMLFCRIYSPVSGRYEATNDPDYEYAN